jgi:hypothetical protein
MVIHIGFQYVSQRASQSVSQSVSQPVMQLLHGFAKVLYVVSYDSK